MELPNSLSFVRLPKTNSCFLFPIDFSQDPNSTPHQTLKALFFYIRVYKVAVVVAAVVVAVVVEVVVVSK